MIAKIKADAKRYLGTLAAVAVIAGVLAAPAFGEDEPSTPAPASPSVADQVINLDFTELAWSPLDPQNPDGPHIAALWGDPFSGGLYGALLRVPAGFESPLHTHSSDERVVQIKGTSIHWEEGGSRDTAPQMTPGDYILVPAGVPHVSAAAPGEESIEFITQDDAFDFALAPGGDE